MERLVKIVFAGESYNGRIYEHKLMTKMNPEELQNALRDSKNTDPTVVELRKYGTAIYVGYSN